MSGVTWAALGLGGQETGIARWLPVCEGMPAASEADVGLFVRRMED
jgi:hypothetical protein